MAENAGGDASTHCKHHLGLFDAHLEQFQTAGQLHTKARQAKYDESDNGIELVDDNEDDHEDQGEYNDITSTNDQNESSSVSSPPELQCFVDSLYFQTKLLKILCDANAPHYLYQEIMEWTQEMHCSEVPLLKALY